MVERYKIELGRAIKRRREELGMTQGELASATHYKEAQTISRWERGENAPADLEVVAKALKWTLAELVAGIEPPHGRAARYLGLAPAPKQDGAPDVLGSINGASAPTHDRFSVVEEELRRLSGAVSELVAGMAELSSQVAALQRGWRTGEGRS